MAGILKLVSGEGRNLEVSRSSEVSDDFWRKVRSEWGQAGRMPNKSILVPLELFSSRTAWLPVACRQFGVSLDPDASVREVIRRGKRDRDSLRQTLRTIENSDTSIVAERLNGGRFVRELRGFQNRDLAKLLRLNHGANFSVPGAGKTTVTLALYEAERLANRVEQLLVICPIAAFEAWTNDAADCFDPVPDLARYVSAEIPDRREILLLNYQRLAASYDAIANWVDKRPTMVVLDEAHRMKRGRSGEWGSACLDIAFLASRRDVLTGTPAPQHPADFIALVDYLWPGQANKILPPASLVAQPSPEAVRDVGPAIEPLFVRTTKDELALPEMHHKVIPVPLSGLHKEIYDSLRSRFSSLVTTQKDRAQLASWGDIMMYLLESATNPALLPAGSSNNDPIEFRHPPLDIPAESTLHSLIAEYGKYETPAKFVVLGKLVKELRDKGRKVLIWSNFIKNIETLERMLALYSPAVVHGGVPSDVGREGSGRTREGEIWRFRNDESCGILLANPAAMGEGISLHQECHDAIYLERTFNAGQYLQSLDRIHRLGLDENTQTNITFLVSEDTIDETVSKRVADKARNLGSMLNDPALSMMSLPDEEDVGLPLDSSDAGDIEALFAHLRGDVLGD